MLKTLVLALSFTSSVHVTASAMSPQDLGQAFVRVLHANAAKLQVQVSADPLQNLGEFFATRGQVDEVFDAACVPAANKRQLDCMYSYLTPSNTNWIVEFTGEFRGNQLAIPNQIVRAVVQNNPVGF